MTQLIETYEEACEVIVQWGIMPLSSFIPGHFSLEAITRSEAWHTGLESDPWLWRDRLPGEGVAAYGRFLAGKPLFVARELFPLVRSALRPARSVEERYEAGLLNQATVRVFQAVGDIPGIDARQLREVAGLRDKANKTDFDHALVDLQSGAEILISGISERLNAQGNKSGWNSTCYMLADHWISAHATDDADLSALTLSREEAREQLFARLEPRWPADALRYLRGKIK
ncbi:MAG TPA: hypothetical protein VF458_01145 [Ktedonobacteraceae bacterium]